MQQPAIPCLFLVQSALEHQEHGNKAPSKPMLTCKALSLEGTDVSRDFRYLLRTFRELHVCFVIKAKVTVWKLCKTLCLPNGLTGERHLIQQEDNDYQCKVWIENEIRRNSFWFSELS